MNQSSPIRAESCAQCITACKECMALLAQEEADTARAPRIEVFRGCARMCALVLEELPFRSAFLAQVSGLCAVLCRDCMEECWLHTGEAFERCAELCAEAARECVAFTLPG